jgi:hypothetical protein
MGSNNLVTGQFINHPRIPDTQYSPSSKLYRAIFDKPFSKQSSSVSDVPKLNVPVPADSGLPGEKVLVSNYQILPLVLYLLKLLMTRV